MEKTLEECLALLLKKCRTWSQDQYNSSLSERWVEDMEKLLPFIPSAFSFISLHHGHQARSPSQNGTHSILEMQLKKRLYLNCRFRIYTHVLGRYWDQHKTSHGAAITRIQNSTLEGGYQISGMRGQHRGRTVQCPCLH